MEPWRVVFFDKDGHKVWRCLLCPKNMSYDDWQHKDHFGSTGHQTKLRNMIPKDWRQSINSGTRTEIPPLYDGTGIVPGYNDG